MTYVQQGKTVKISATSKATVQFQNNYYSFAYGYPFNLGNSA